jgi:hypothetical protein
VLADADLSARQWTVRVPGCSAHGSRTARLTSAGRRWSEAVEEGEEGVGGSVAAGAGVRWGEAGEGFLLDAHVGVQVGGGGTGVFVAKSAMTEVSTPACSSAMAAEWRRVCGVTFLAARLGQCVAARVACLVTSLATASRDNGRPCRVANTGSPGLPGCSASQTRRAATVCRVSGMARSLRPLPWQRTCEPPSR